MKLFLASLFLLANLSAQPSFFDTTWNRDSYAWQTNIVTSGGTISVSSYLTGVRFINQVQQWGVRPRIGRANLYLGNQTNAMLCPIITDWSGGAPAVINDDLIAFVAADYSEATGLTGNTSTKYLRCSKATGLGISTFTVHTNLHMAVYVRTASNEASDEMGVAFAGTGNYGIAAGNGGSTYIFMGLNTPSTANTNAGFVLSTRTASNAAVTYKNGTAVVTDNTADGGSLASGFLVVHAFNSAGTVGGFDSRPLSYYAVGLSISATLQGPYRIAVRNVQLAKGRNVE